MNISLYKKITDVNSSDIIDLDIFIENIRGGYWQDEILSYRNGKREKKSLPSVTISGSFSSRRDNALVEHSGFICIDIDNHDPNEIKEILTPDEYVYSVFTSVSGNGTAVLFKITPTKHQDAFRAIAEYLLKKYGLVVDPTGVNLSRARFVSFDPFLYLNKSAKKWTTYQKKEKEQKHHKIVFVKNDFDNIIYQLQKSNIDITYNYNDWIKIGFALSDHFGEAGRSYFHAVSEISSKYGSQVCDKQYDACLKANGHGVTIASFYWLAKNAGIQTYSPQTIEIIKKAKSMKQGGMTESAIKENFTEFTDYEIDNIEEILPQVDNGTQLDEVSIVEEVQSYIRMNYNIRRNVISRNLEIEKSGQYIRMENIHFNSIYLKVKKTHEKITYDLVERIIISEDTRDYNPILDFYTKYQDRKPTGVISKLINTITSEYGLKGELREYFFTKWVVGIASAAHGVHSPLMLILSGKEQNTGKTEFCRRFLPTELQPYYAESKLDAGKDDEIMMTQKILIMDDEMGGKSKREAARLKELTSKQTFSLREPYGRNNVDLNRLAVLCGTSNVDEILNDPTGNRRIIPIHVATGIDHKTYNEIDKIDVLIEGYHLYKSGYKWQLDKKDINLLCEHTTKFEAASLEEELINKYFRTVGDGESGEWFTTTDIIVYVEMNTRQKMNIQKVGSVLQKIGHERKGYRQNGKTAKGYYLYKVLFEQKNEAIEDHNDLPF